MKAKNTVVLLGLMAGVMFSGSAVQAQTTAETTVPVQRPWRIKLGGFFPTESALRDDFGETFFAYGVSYDFGKSAALNPLIYSVYLDGATKSKDVDDFDARLTYNGVGASLRYSINPPTEPVRFYAGVGLGVYFLNGKFTVENDLGQSIGSTSENKTQLGGKIFAGTELAQGIFGEADYTYINDVFDTEVSGFTLSVGYRF